MTHIVLILHTAVLGAVGLAQVLLYLGWKRNREQINQLRAVITAQQIASAIGTGTGTAGNLKPITGHQSLEPEPARRRGHLALYLGGGVAAAFTTCRRSLSESRRHILTVTAAATVAAAGTAAATLALVPSVEPGAVDVPITPAPPSKELRRPRPPTQYPSGATVSAGGDASMWSGDGPPDPGQGDEDEKNRARTAAPGASTPPAQVRDVPPPEHRPPTSTPPMAAPLRTGAPESSPSATTEPPMTSAPTTGGGRESAPSPTRMAPLPQLPALPPPLEPPSALPTPPIDDEGAACVDIPPLLDACLLAAS
ncbi:hypothetical protein [Streptomyces fuscigenes]|uniref:hypothetical protein n=1 Tax=Streptomyces fuscigenes TaxID=1528880 RepID=UPI001F24014A|nr:hypothetical protein [Streptomyces fuscigenes]MCF3960343.1 hypothetical protein [Streptomyces fuscigenes]